MLQQPATVDEPGWRRRLVEALARARQRERPLAILAIAGATQDIASALSAIDELASGDSVTVVMLPDVVGEAPMRRLSDELAELERRRMTEALARTGGVKTRAAAMLGMPIRTFNMRVRQYDL